VIKQQQIIEYIKKIPPLPNSIKLSLEYLEKGDLQNAAKVAQDDKALSNYLIDLVNKPYFGFKTRVENINQIFGILGIKTAKQILYSYLISTIAPKSWKVFNLTNKEFYKLQSETISNWNKILKYENRDEDWLQSSINFVLLSIFVAEEIFKDNFEDFMIIKQVKEINYDDLLRKFTNMSLLEIAAFISKKWEADKTIISMLKDLSKKDASNKNYGKFVKYMHLLLFYQLSKPEFMKAGLNDFMEFDPNFVEDIFEDFNKIVGTMEIYETSNQT